MSGVFPASPAFQRMSISSSQPTLMTRSISGRRQVRQVAGQWWSLTGKFPPMTREQFAPIYAFVLKQRGSFETFTIVPPVFGTNLGSGAGSPRVVLASQTGRTLNTDGWTAGTQVLKAGDFITIAGDTKVYALTADVTSGSGGSAGLATLNLEPALIESPANDAVITVSSIAFTVACKGDVQEFSTSAKDVFVYEIDFEESF